MAMKVVKKTSEYTIYQRGDKRYAVQDANKRQINGEDKVRILVEEGLLTVAVAAAPEPEPDVEEAAEEPAAEAPAEEEAAAEEAPEAEEAAEEEKDK